MTDIYRSWFKIYHPTCRGKMNDWEELWFRVERFWTDSWLKNTGFPMTPLDDCTQWQRLRRKLAFVFPTRTFVPLWLCRRMRNEYEVQRG